MHISVGELVFDLAVAGSPGDPLVLMLHGFPQTNYSWRHQLDPLAEAGYFVVAPNQRGYSAGARPESVSAYATENLVADARALMDELGDGHAHVVGHDWGGQLSWLLAAHHPQQVDTLTVLSRPHPQAFVAAFKNDAQQASRSKHHKIFQDSNIAGQLLQDNAQRLRKMFADQGVSVVDQDAYLEVLADPQALDAAINWYRAPVQGGSDQPLATGNTPAVGVPTTYIWGDADATVGAMAAEGTAAWVTGEYRFEVLPGIGHFVTDQAGARVTEILLDQLRA